MIRWVKIFLGVASMFYIGIILDQYNLNFFYNDLPMLIERGGPHPSTYFMEAEELAASLMNDMRWISVGFSLVIMAGLTIFVLYSYFLKLYVVKLVTAFYILLTGVAGICGVSSLLVPNFKQGYLIAQEIKDLLELPFILILLFPLLYFIEKTREASKASIPAPPEKVKKNIGQSKLK